MDELEKEIEKLFQTAEKERYIHSRSKETFDNISGLWFLGNEFEKTLSQITKSYIVSSFLLKTLGCIYQRIRSEYSLSDFRAIDLTDEVVAGWFKEELAKLKNDDKFIAWLRKCLLPACDAIINAEIEGLDEIARLGNSADSTQRISELYVDQEDGEIWCYDSIFQFHEFVVEQRRETK